MTHDETISIIVKGSIGAISATFGVITSFQEDVIWVLRVIALLAGIGVSVATAISVLRGKKQRHFKR